jgi:hypothetical protein
MAWEVDQMFARDFLPVGRGLGNSPIKKGFPDEKEMEKTR